MKQSRKTKKYNEGYELGSSHGFKDGIAATCLFIAGIIVILMLITMPVRGEPVVVKTNYTFTSSLGPSFNLSDNSTCHKEANATVKGEDGISTSINCFSANNLFKEIIFARDLQATCSGELRFESILNITRDAILETKNQTKEILDYNNKTKDFPLRFAECYGKNQEISLSLQSCTDNLGTEKSKTANLTKEKEALENSLQNVTEQKKNLETTFSNCQSSLSQTNNALDSKGKELDLEKAGATGKYFVGALAGVAMIYFWIHRKTPKAEEEKEFGSGGEI